MRVEKPDFAAMELGAARVVADAGGWKAAAGAEAGRSWMSPEGIPVRAVYSAQDEAGLDFADGWPGFAPFVRGPYPTMYVQQPWTIRQYAGFSTAEDLSLIHI